MIGKFTKGKWQKHHSPITGAGWATVTNLREGDEMAVISPNDFGNSFGNLSKSLGRERTKFGTNESLVNRYDFADENKLLLSASRNAFARDL